MVSCFRFYFGLCRRRAEGSGIPEPSFLRSHNNLWIITCYDRSARRRATGRRTVEGQDNLLPSHLFAQHFGKKPWSSYACSLISKMARKDECFVGTKNLLKMFSFLSWSDTVIHCTLFQIAHCWLTTLLYAIHIIRLLIVSIFFGRMQGHILNK